MPKPAPKKNDTEKKQSSKEPYKRTGRPVTGAKQSEKVAVDTTSLAKEIKESVEAANEAPTPPVVPHVVVEVTEEETVSKQQEEISVQNVAEAITTEDPQAIVSVRRNVSSVRMFFLALFIGIVIGSFIFGGLILFDTYKADLMPTPTPAVAESTPTPTKEPEIDVSSFKVQVLNGTGTSGVAKSVAQVLESGGFSDVATGNAKQTGYTETEVQIKKSLPAGVFLKIKTLLKDYKVVEVTALPEDADFDVIITVGT